MGQRNLMFVELKENTDLIGKKYENFISQKLGLEFYKNKLEQYNIGETKFGIEIKCDMLLERTGNIFIEIAEKRNSTNLEYVRSGVFRDDNSWLYLIGNYAVAYVFLKRVLQEQSTLKNIIEIKKQTAKGFLLTENEARELCEKIFNFI